MRSAVKYAIDAKGTHYMFKRFSRNRTRYARRDGTLRIEEVHANEITVDLPDDYLEDGNLQQALRRLMQEGVRGQDGRRTMGLREMMQRMRNMRQEQLNRYNMASGVMDDLREKLEEIKQLERQGIQHRLDDTSTDSQQPAQPSTGEQPSEQRQGEQVERQPASGSSGDQQGQSGQSQDGDDLTPEQKRKMLEMIAKRKQEYLDKLPQDIPGQIKGLSEYDFMDDEAREKFNELIEQMQQQMAAMQGIMDNLSPEQRQELQDLMEQLMGDDRIRVDLMELAGNLEAMAPMEQMRTRFPFRGDESLPLNEAMRMMGRLQQMEGLEDQIQEARRLDNLEAIDSDKVKDLLGDEEYQSVEQLKELMRVLEEAGYIQKKGNRWELTARGIRKIGQKALQDIFNKLKRDGFGRHISPFRGVGGERTDESKPYQFGDPFLLDLEKTLMNALHRRGTGTPVGLEKDDFEVYRTEFTTQSSTVLMIDMSLSMVYNGCQPAAKKVAVALQSLIRSQFPRDNLHVVGFSFVAREYKPQELVEMSRFDNDTGTNMAHGLMLSRQLLSRHHGVNKQIIMITDGGPTVWYEDGEWQFGYPPNPFAEQQTLLEVQRCTREGITINTFMLEDDRWMVAFVNQLSSINHGRTFYTDKNNLGEYLLIDYLNSKRKYIA